MPTNRIEYQTSLFQALNKDGTPGSRVRSQPIGTPTQMVTTVFFKPGQIKPNVQQAFRLADACFEHRPFAIRCPTIEDGLRVYRWITSGAVEQQIKTAVSAPGQ